MRNNVFSIMIWRSLVLTLLIFAAAKAFGTEIQFSTAEGYPADAAPLNGAPEEKPAWITTPDAFSVDGTAKEVRADTEIEAATALLTAPIPLAAGKTVTISTDFEFEGLNTDLAEGDANIHGPNIGLGTSSTELFKNALSVLFGHFSWDKSDYVLQVNPGGKFANIASGQLGVDKGGAPSDRLRFKLQLTKGEQPNEWSYQVTLFNVTQNVEVASFEGSGMETSQEFYDSPNVFLNITRGNNAKTGGPAAMTLFNIKID